MELLLKQPTSELPAVVLPADQVLAKISTMKELADMEKLQQELVSCRTSFVKSFKPIKEHIDAYKKQALDYEKQQISKIEQLEDKNKTNISMFKAEVAKLQSEYKTLVEKIPAMFAKLKTELDYHSKNIEKISLELDRLAIQNSKTLAYEKAEQLEQLDKSTVNVEVQNIKPHQIQPPVFAKINKKNTIVGKETRYIKDEQAAIEWCLINYRQGVKIELKLSEIKKLLDTEYGQNLPFVGVTTTY